MLKIGLRSSAVNFLMTVGFGMGGAGVTPKSTYLILPSGDLKNIVKREGIYCFVKKVKGKYEYPPLNPQPLESEILELHRYYTSLKANKNYKKRVSWLGLGGRLDIAVVEYIGQYPGVAPHGNSKYKMEYVRTPDYVMDEMSQMLKSTKPKLVYDKLTNKHDELSAPSNFRQVRDKKGMKKWKKKRRRA